MKGIQARVFEYLREEPPVDLILVADSKDAIKVADAAAYLDYRPFVLPDLRATFGDDLRPFKDELLGTLSTLSNFFSFEGKKILVGPIRTLSYPLPRRELLKVQKLEFAQSIHLSSLKEQMLCWGYNFVDVVEEEGEVSFRGDIIDIFSPGAKAPVRIVLFGDEIESIRFFDVSTQKSIKEELEEVWIKPALFGLSSTEYEELSQRVKELESDAFIKDLASSGLWVLGKMGCNYLLLLRAVCAHDLTAEILEICRFAKGSVFEKKPTLRVIPEASDFRDIESSDINLLLDFHKEKKIVIIAKNETTLRRSEIKSFEGIDVVYKDIILNLIGKNELILSLNKPSKPKKAPKISLILDELKNGDYVVHEKHGIGIFEGVVQLSILGATRDFVSLRYQGDDKLLVPVENLDTVDRYIADAGTVPVLDRLGKGSFARLKESVRQKLFAIAGEIVVMAARRELTKGPIITVEPSDIASFQKDAGFEYTDDQVKAIGEIFEDLQSGCVMDRLLSGDVGFGKTEVAMNAIFAVARSGFQSAIICPTTLLSSQHHKTLSNRLGRYGIKVARLDRFVSAKEQKEVLKGLKEGRVDVVVGTHALLNAEFANLALVVVDEEHKFGVKQKERLKELQENVHLLFMSATPIPRSLNMALSSIKGLSQLMTPPSMREGVRTFVKEYDEKLIKEVIIRELRRGGQIFYIFNSIATIDSKKAELTAILPTLRILVLHSHVPASVSEKEILRFEQKEYDLLLSTSIVESGIHLPNVNTIIVDGADRFGMADLHQLRGRVGRGVKEGYCYFLVENKQALSGDAKRRLVALESHSFLGSGSVLAYHDLEIRGGGNLLGEAQSGHIKNIGYSLYLRMLEEAIGQLTGKIAPQKKEVDLRLSVSAYITPSVVLEDRVRLELYRRLSHCQSLSEVYEIEDEMVDRFGKLDTQTRQFLDLIVIKILAINKSIVSISNYNENITVVFGDGKKELIKAKSRDDDDLLDATLRYLRKKEG